MYKLKTVERKVVLFLEDKEELRDSDNKLVASIWWSHIKETRNPSKMSALDLLIALGNNELPSWETLTRCRRKVQEKRTDLRGKKYDARQKHQKEVIKDLREYNMKN